MRTLRHIVSVGLATASLWLIGCANASRHVEHAPWGYDGRAAPNAWGSLSPEYGRCASGDAQSPVDLSVDYVESTTLPPLAIDYGATRTTEENNGHTIQDWVQPGDFVELDGVRFELEQFHFHHPSEHTLNGVGYPLEIHLVHRSGSGAILVLGVMVAEGSEHPVLRVLFDDLPRGHEKLVFMIDPAALLPANNHYILYDGSLTTPPCTEGVTWIVLTDPLAASPEQIQRFAALFPHNNRPVMPLNGRVLRAISGP